MNREEIEAWIDSAAILTFSRSGGPGGQNVNKVNSKVTAVLPIDDRSPLSPEERERITRRFPNRVNSEGSLYVQAQAERSQLENRRLALLILADIIRAGLAREKPRRPTKPSRRADSNRLDRKRAAAQKKRRRSWHRDDD